MKKKMKIKTSYDHIRKPIPRPGGPMKDRRKRLYDKATKDL
jgi:hypothetical protein